MTVFAPDHNWSAAGHTKTMHKPLRVTRAPPDDIPLFVTTGTPSDCVGLALLGLVPEPVDLVVSGINMGANLGHDVTYSGTVAGAMEGAVIGLPAIAASIEDDRRHGPAISTSRRTSSPGLPRHVLERGLPRYGLLNVNFPALPAPPKSRGVRVTRLGVRHYHDVVVERARPRGPALLLDRRRAPDRRARGRHRHRRALHAAASRSRPLNLDMTDAAN